MPKTVPQLLKDAAATYEQRNAIYGNNYKRFGMTMTSLFPNGLTLRTAEDWNRYGVLVQIVSKMGRYCENFDNGGHPDSLHDMAVYAAMLLELDKASEPELDLAQAEAR